MVLPTLAAACLLLAAPAIGFVYEAPDDCDWTLIDDEAVELVCHLSAINSNMEKTNFSVIPSRHTRSLTVKCGDSAISSLEPSGFGGLKELEHLAIVDCNIQHLPPFVFEGLARLKSLKIATKHSATLQIDSHAFAGLAQLQSLDLSGVYLSALPVNELCHRLPKLRLLNLTRNEVGSLDDLGVIGQQECLSEIEMVDLSFNEITTLSAHKLLSSPTLLELKLANNYVRHIDAAVFNNVSVIDLSNNQISALPATVFHQTRLSWLSLANNSLSALEPATFDGQDMLTHLDLSGNLLVSSQISARLMRDSVSLSDFDLSRNRVKELDSAMFTPMTNLRALRLNNNQLENLPARVFAPLRHLRELDLAHNSLKRLEPFSLTGLDKITHLLVSHNRLETVHDAAFQNCSAELVVVDLSHNELSVSPAALKHLRVLQTLDLSHNRIGDIAGAPFLHMPHLWRLQLNGNEIRNITVGLFDKLESLQILDLSSNYIEEVERGAFDGNQMLRAVRLDANNLRTMDGLFQNMAELIWLNMSDNNIGEFDYAMVPRNLHWLDISHNKIEELGNYFDLTSEIELGVLDASFNALKQLGPRSIPDGIETVLVNDNQISQLVPYTFFKKAQLVKVDLTVNNLKSIDQNALRLSSDAKTQPDFFLGGNPIECDCDMVWFKTINSVNTIQNFPHVKDIESIYCRLVHSRDFVPLVEAANDQFLCPYTSHCFALCQCCDFDACDCDMTCPDNCTCFHDNTWSKNIAQCSNGGFHDLPAQMPMDATEILLDGNILPVLHSHTLIGRKNLKVLHLNNSQIHTIKNKTFSGLKSLSVLHLENNQIRELHGFEFETLSNLRELYLQGNIIERIHNATFKHLHKLEVLFLDGNRLLDFPVWQLAFNPFLVSVKLADNLWSCECEYMERFRSWMSVYANKIYDYETISCISNEADGLHNVNMADLSQTTCHAVATTRVQQQLVNEDYLPLLAATLASFAIVLLILLAVFVYRHNLRVWIHSKYGVRVFDNLDVEAGDSEKMFDAFMSYSPKDDMFVRHMLAPELEQQYKLCLYHRDLPAHHTFVADTIVQASEASRRTVVVLSENFLKSEWSRYDYKSGLHQALRSERKKLIVILLGDVHSRDLDPDLRLYLKANIVLQWGDKLFWEKLKYSLPDAATKKQINVVKQQQQQPRYTSRPSTLNNNRTLPNLPAAQVPPAQLTPAQLSQAQLSQPQMLPPPPGTRAFHI